MSNRNQIAAGVCAIGVVFVILGIVFISVYNHAKDTTDAHVGGWLMAAGVLFVVVSAPISDREANLVYYDEELDGEQAQ